MIGLGTQLKTTELGGQYTLLALLVTHFSIFSLRNTPGYYSLCRCSYWCYKHAFSPNDLLPSVSNPSQEDLLGSSFMETQTSHLVGI